MGCDRKRLETERQTDRQTDRQSTEKTDTDTEIEREGRTERERGREKQTKKILEQPPKQKKGTTTKQIKPQQHTLTTAKTRVVTVCNQLTS